MTVERTREIFGDKMANLSNDEVLAFIGNMSTVCDGLLDLAINQLTKPASSINIEGGKK